ncbi:MAG: hypothetical protein BWY31_01576 [Lentisphaerae bacterium ADurb.Bin242]|nr:MAG: hypothetical protein BWY31_01576 [Lentisphaerae bacterium ADurb.Bin242]
MSLDHDINNNDFLLEAFAAEQVCLCASLNSSKRITHNGDRGEVNELFFIDFLRRYLPNRYTVEKAIVLDHTGAVSDSIDIVVFDRQYTPTLLDNNHHRYVPAEAVYAVFECKPTINKGYLEYAAKKAASVRKLKRTSISIHHAGGTYPPKEPFHIVAGILSINVDWESGVFGEPFEAVHSYLTGDEQLDCGFAAYGASFDIYDGKYSYGPRQNALAYFAFRLLAKLQTLATVPAVNWQAYANAIAEHGIR